MSRLAVMKQVRRKRIPPSINTSTSDNSKSDITPSPNKLVVLPYLLRAPAGVLTAASAMTQLAQSNLPPSTKLTGSNAAQMPPKVCC